MCILMRRNATRGHARLSGTSCMSGPSGNGRQRGRVAKGWRSTGTGSTGETRWQAEAEAPAPLCRPPQQLNKCCGLDAGNVETFPASHVFAHYLVIQQNHIAGGLLELGAVAFVGVTGQAVHFGANQPL